MILNKPVLNSGVGGLKTIFKNNDYLICNNIEQYISKIDYLLSNVKKYDYYDIIDDNTFRKKIYEIYSWEKVLQWINLKLYFIIY